MLNDIAAQFGYLPDDRATEEIAGHVRRFWDPRMRARLLDPGLDGAEALTPAARAAVDRLRGAAQETAQETAR